MSNRDPRRLDRELLFPGRRTGESVRLSFVPREASSSRTLFSCALKIHPAESILGVEAAAAFSRQPPARDTRPCKMRRAHSSQLLKECGDSVAAPRRV